jgi:hypothetical protein
VFSECSLHLSVKNTNISQNPYVYHCSYSYLRDSSVTIIYPLLSIPKFPSRVPRPSPQQNRRVGKRGEVISKSILGGNRGLYLLQEEKGSVDCVKSRLIMIEPLLRDFDHRRLRRAAKRSDAPAHDGDMSCLSRF